MAGRISAAAFSALTLLVSVALLAVNTVESVHLMDEDGFFLEALNRRRSRRRRQLEDAMNLWSADEPADEPAKQADCKTFQVLLTTNDTAVGLIDGFNSFEDVDFGVIQGGNVLLSNPEDENDKIGSYTVLTTFLSPVNFTDFTVDCYGVGAYQFGIGEQIAFVSPCSGSPFFSITGGQGEYNGATGFVEFMIPDPEGRGFLHDIHVCSSRERMN
ncbi:expressed unknown protein [Seminavis robusta]|uniref:Dirigent protein n=1 Tax=Seminavis robusta TaxID=568900 RepID=A0A9N8D6F7_9STRA|nr:expressed unknown protein [Seminavis robusta]|eukprot:Sro17_g012340.1 n/a (215) ;mRNA; f:82316-82960